MMLFFKDEYVTQSFQEHDMYLNLARSEHFYKFGPAIDVLVCYEGPQGKGSFNVDIVPFIQEKQFGQHVINPYYSEFVFTSDGKGGSCRSFSRSYNILEKKSFLFRAQII